jgi:signal transduction histidine kinase
VYFVDELWRRREVAVGRFAFWLFLLGAGLVLSVGSVAVGGVVGVWLATTAGAGLAWWLGLRDRRHAGRFLVSSALIELVGILLLVALTGGADSILVVGLIAWILATARYGDGVMSPWLGSAAVAGFVVVTAGHGIVQPESAGHDPGPVATIAIFLVGAAGFSGVLHQRRMAALSATQEAIEARRVERSSAGTRSDALLAATAEFLRAKSTDALSRAILRACGAMFGTWKSHVTLVDRDGGLRVAASAGFSPEELDSIDNTQRDLGALARRALVGEETWLDEDGPAEARARAAAFSATSMFVLPIQTRRGTVGVISALFEDERHFDEAFREAARGLAAQAGLTHELIATRTQLEKSAGALERQSDILESAIVERTLQLQQAADELRLANQAKSEFLTNVSHELRTPLTAILGFSDVLVKGLDGPLNTAQFEDAQTIQTSSRRLLELIDDLIDISRIEAGRIEIRRERLSPRELVAGTVEEIRPLAGEKGLDLSVDVEGLPDHSMVDRARLHEILLNLLSNAVKFTPPGGQVRVLGRCLDPETMAIDVVDTGIGVAAGDLERIFEKFHRIAGPEHPGTGLGLAIARQLARLHGGDVVAESTPGLGSRFRLTMPIVTSITAVPSDQGLTLTPDLAAGS